MAEAILNGNGINERCASPIRRIIVALGRKLDFSIKTIAMKHQNNIGRYHMWPTPEINSIVLFSGVESISGFKIRMYIRLNTSDGIISLLNLFSPIPLYVNEDVPLRDI